MSNIRKPWFEALIQGLRRPQLRRQPALLKARGAGHCIPEVPGLRLLQTESGLRYANTQTHGNKTTLWLKNS